MLTPTLCGNTNAETCWRVRISTANQEALVAVHEFLRFQIEDHQTGDSTEIESGRQ